MIYIDRKVYYKTLNIYIYIKHLDLKSIYNCYIYQEQYLNNNLILPIKCPHTFISVINNNKIKNGRLPKEL